MQIPQSAIEPFGVLFFPKLHFLKHESITAALDSAFEIMNNSGEVSDKNMGLDGIQLFLYDVLRDYDACLETFNAYDWEDNTLCVVDLVYSKSTGESITYGGYIRSNAGFRKPVIFR